MVKCKITVLKRTINTDIVQEYCENKFTLCPKFIDGQEFITAFEKPEGFCSWAWCDISKYLTVLLSNGNFSEGLFDGWMKNKNTMIACCTDGLRPVIFKLEKLED